MMSQFFFFFLYFISFQNNIYLFIPMLLNWKMFLYVIMSARVSYFINSTASALKFRRGFGFKLK